MPADPPQGAIRVVALYRFFPFEDCAEHRARLAAFCCARGLKGTLLLAPEGFNGTLAGAPDAIDALVTELSALPGAAPVDAKYSQALAMPFHRMKVRLKREIVTMGVPGLDPRASAGCYVEPADWNALIADPDTVVIDTRNDYEVRLGSFAGALDPGTSSFREFPGWLESQRDRLAGRKVAMFCTGGIRCEKATAHARSIGLEDVYHLKGGVLRYLEETDAASSLWRGACFVFDERVAVEHGLEESDATLCRACRLPLTVEDRQSPHYKLGISCARCHDRRSDDDRRRYAERQRQVEQAEALGRPKPIGARADARPDGVIAFPQSVTNSPRKRA